MISTMLIRGGLTYRPAAGGLVEKLLKEPKLYDVFGSPMGKDLSYLDAPSLNLNLPSKDSPHKNYLLKDWHQEVWSGASISNLQIWTPLL